ncbi:hypothetical protein GGR31_001766 [Mesonia maritima]|uniref:Uncharacterized protein n=1 Tax=Mesonia maritima TaxID=1793873 RepID=A0ABU1K690_9FLAO|nr:hypothetical protein [Mesonia maritima]
MFLLTVIDYNCTENHIFKMNVENFQVFFGRIGGEWFFYLGEFIS